MSDLSGYIANTIQLDKSNILLPVLRLTDTGVYPVGVPATITGIVNITQPDGIKRTGNWSTPDIVYSGSGTLLNPASIPLRLDVGNLLQQGTYIVEYIINATGYAPTTLLHTFSVSFTEPVITIQENFNLVTPSLAYQDATVYNNGSYTASIARSWSSIMSAGTVTGVNAVLDLAFGGSYYDSLYSTTLTSTVIYQHNSYAYLSVKDVITTVVKRDIYTLPSQASILTNLTAFKAKVDLANSVVADNLQKQYLNAFALWRHANARICSADFNGVDKYFTQILAIFQGNQTPTLVHTNAPIAPYVYTCETGTGTYTPVYISVKVGSAAATALGIVAGQNTITNAGFVGHNINMWSDDIPVDDQNFGDGALFFTKVLSANLITLSANLVTGQKIKIVTL